MSSRSLFSLPLSTSITLNPCLPFCLSYIITVQSVSPFDTLPLLPFPILPSGFPVLLMYCEKNDNEKSTLLEYFYLKI